LPTGTVTFLFTDIEGSTKLWEAHPEEMRVALARHDALMRETIVSANGYVFQTVGDAFCAAFAMAPDAVSAALAMQIALNTEPWPEETPIKVRMALHTGTVESRDGDYFGPALNRVARLLPIGYGGQTLLSQTTYLLSRDSLPDAVSLRDLGAHRLKDLALPELVYELQHRGLTADFPPLKSLSTHPNNLPQQLTSFIGREKEIAEIGALLAKARLLTLTGSGGSGKTRLCLQAAAESLEQFPDGAWFVELAPLVNPDLVPQTVATVLGVTEEPGKPIIQTLSEHLKHKRLLLLLDNCEHLLEACAKVVNPLMHQCRGVHILASSREALGVEGEQTYRVPSLSLPDRKQAQTLQTLSTYESVQLFIDRALLVRADFQVTNQNAPALASVCCHLDGIPLAIELAAARVRSLSVEEIDGKLDQRFGLLAGGSRTALPRHRTLRALIDWSYDLLNEHEQRLLQRLSVFAGGWTLAAAEQTCADDGVADGEILDLLTSLSDKSLVSVEQNDGHSRYRLLETVRQYARARLMESGGEAVEERHRDYFLALAEQAAGAQLTGENLRHWSPLLELESDNLRTALQWSIDDPTRAQAALRICGALRSYWWRWGRGSEGRDWCDKALRSASSAEPTKPLLEALIASGVMQYAIGDLTAATSTYERALVVSQELRAASLEGVVLRYMANVKMASGQTEAAQSMYHRSIAIHRTLGELSPEAASLTCLASLLINEGKLAAAEALLERALMLSQQLGDLELEAYNVSRLGSVAQYENDYASANIRHERALSIARDLGIRELELEQLRHLGEVAVGCGEFEKARILFRESLALGRDQDSWFHIRECIDAVIALATATEHFEVATRLSGAVEHLRLTMAAPRFPIDQERFEANRAQCHAELGNGTYESATVAGSRLQPDKAIAAAMAWLEQR